MFLLALASLLFAATVNASTAAAADPPTLQRTNTGVTADGLPTVQIDGVVWDQVISGDTVFAGGQFSYARPAGTPVDTDQKVARTNLLAYNIRTGQLITSFAPTLNGQVKDVAMSPDGSRLYIGGSFTTVNGVARNRLAALNPSTGALITTFNAGVSAAVSAIAVTDNAVYVGGNFSSVGASTRTRLAAFNPTSGALLGWAPAANAGVNALVMTPDKSRVIVAGAFNTLNGETATGIGAIDATSGATLPWAANNIIHNYGSSAAMVSLSSDGTNIYSTGYWYGGTGNFEGILAADPNTGNIKWLADCHGDTYDAGAAGGIVYAVSHWHYCGNIGGFPDTNPRTQWYRSNAVTADAQGTVRPNGQCCYGDFQGTPAPATVNWFPTMDVGSFTGQGQAGWTTEGTSEYVVQGGEFPKVNGVAQQGLVRFAVPSLATKKQGPRLAGAAINPTLLNVGNGAVRIKWPTNWDRDDQVLNYDVFRQGTATPIFTTSATSQFWNRPSLSFTDTNVVAGRSYSYRVAAYDGDGNRVLSEYVPITVSATISPYVGQVLADGASNYWRMSGARTSYPDYVGDTDLTARSGTTANAGGAVNGDTDGSATFNGTSDGMASTTIAKTAPNTFTAEAWFNTTTTSGGKIVGFGGSTGSLSSNYDRHVYMTNDGRITYGVYPGAVRALTSGAGFNDGQWHHVVAELSSAGQVLYLDGLKIGSNTTTTSGQPYDGYWRIGGDNIGGWPDQPSSAWFNGSIDEVAIYPTALSGVQVRDHYTKSGHTVDIPPAPTDAYGAKIYADNPTFFWRLDETSGTAAKDVSPNKQDGIYAGGSTFGQASNVGAPAGTAVAFNGSNGTIASKNLVSNPTAFTQELWFKTTTTNGGKLIGFGNTQSGTSNNYDRHVYMENNGRLTFGTYTGQLNTTTSAQSYNDNQWHHLVASQGGEGMKLFVDGAQVGANPQTSAQAYNGYWRVGGDTSWCCQPWFNGTIDEVAIYDTQLPASTVVAHYRASDAAANTPPVGAFTSTCTEGACAFDGTGSTDTDGTVASYAWTFGDGDTSTDPAPTHGFTASGNYTVSLTVTDNKGATNTLTRTVAVTVLPANQLPTAVIANTCNELDCTFDGTGSTDPDGSVDAYAWNFGDGSTSTLAQPTHTYTADGSYTVTLKVTDSRGGTNTVTKSITVRANLKPVPAFTYTCTDLVCGFNSAGSVDPDGTVTAFNWNFGDGSTESADANPTHTFDQAGTYNVKLTLTDDHNATASKTTAVTVTVNALPVAAFSTNCTALSCAPDGSASSDSDGTIVSWAWTYGDGSPGVTGQVPAPHTYEAAGTYTITLTVTDNKGATNTVAKAVTVTLPPNQLPTATFTNSCSELVCTFDGSGSTDTDGTLVGYLWDFGDGVTADVPKPPHTYANAGTYTVSLKVTDNRGGSNTTTKQVVVSLTVNNPPVASFTSNCTALACAFDASASTDSDGTIASYGWNFGDSSTGTGVSPNHTYSAAGTYNVTLTVTDNSGSTTTRTNPVTVVTAANQEPVAAFTATVSGLTASFDGSGSSDPDGTVASYAWTFGDGSTGTGQTPSKTYAGTGTYTVKLTVTDNAGATKSITKSVIVGSSPIAADNFNRSVTRWGNADTGGAWTYSGTTFSTNGDTGDIKLAAASAGATASLSSVSARDLNLVADIAYDTPATGGGTYTTFITRKVGTSDYRMTLRESPNGVIRLNLTKTVNNTATSLRDVVISGVTYNQGDTLRVRLTVSGNGTTALAGKVWKVGTPEPATAQVTATDSTASLQAAGSFALYTYLSGSATAVPVTIKVDNLRITAP